MPARLGTALVGACLVALALATPADASFPGQNGKIAFVRSGDIWTMNPDGTDQVNITNSPESEQAPAWSPDGTKIAFGILTGCCTQKIWTMNADGTGGVKLSDDSRGTDYDPAWSPTGAKILFASCCPHDPGLWTMNVDGTGASPIAEGFYDVGRPDWSPLGNRFAFMETTQLCNSFLLVKTAKLDFSDPSLLSPPSCSGPILDSYEPSWSPDAHRIAFFGDDEVSFAALFTIKPDGTDRQQISGGVHPAWSPDGTKIAVGGIPDFGSGRIAVENSDGTDFTPITSGSPPDYEPDWQPLTVRGYPRPRGANPLYVSLVPAYKQCVTPTSTHGAPLAFPSCSPPSLTSGFLTVGTSDANGQQVNSIGSVRYTALNEPLPLDPNNGDQSDVQVDFSMTDVRNKSDLSDYTGSLRLSPNLRITDHDNGAGTGSATVADIPLALDAPCNATVSGSTGARCTLHSTVEAFVPGSVKERKRAVWELGQVQVFDGGPDGNPASADNTLFAVQGVFVP